MDNIVWHEGIDRSFREKYIGNKSVVLWFFGLSGSGKSTIASALEKRIIESGKPAYLLDGDNVRHGLCADLGFSEEDRTENIRRIAQAAALFYDASVTTLVSAITPCNSMRKLASSIIPDVVMIYVKADIQTCIERDPKGLYKKALKGEIENFTGIDAVFEEPEHADIVLDTTLFSVEECVQKVYEYIKGV